uniref:Caenorhabditis elegans ly-6-related family-containing protein n=1 Tax=Rhabditophanes sp. KR3021 TaxID=114890 RepID=A0AC35UBE2_9BILA
MRILLPMLILASCYNNYVLTIQCFSCASEEYEPLFKKGAFSFNFKNQELFQPRFDYACDNSFDVQNYVPVKECQTNCIVVFEKQFFGGMINENRPYLFIRGCASDVFVAGNSQSPEIQFLQKQKICLPLMVSQIWPHVQSNEFITACSCDEDGCNIFDSEVNIAAHPTSLNYISLFFLLLLLYSTIFN